MKTIKVQEYIFTFNHYNNLGTELIIITFSQFEHVKNILFFKI